MSDVSSTFIHESEEDILKLNNALLELEDDPESADAMETVFRVAHNLKGNFGVMGFTDASNLAHAVEDLLDGIRQGGLRVTPERMDLIFAGVDELEAMVDEIGDDGETTTDPTGTIEAIRGSIEGGEGSETTPADDAGGPALEIPADALFEEVNLEDDLEVFHVDVDVGDSQSKRIDAMFVLDSTADEYELLRTVPPRGDVEDGEFDGSFDAYVAVDSTVETGDVEGFYDESRYVEGVSVDSVTEEVLSAKTTESEPEATDEDDDSSGGSSVTHRSKEVESIRVDVEQIDQLYNQVEEMVTSRIKLRKIIEGSELVEAEEELEEHGKITSSLQDTVLEIRMVPLKKIVGNFPRVVRDLSREQDKEIDFRMEGVDIEMDRSILNELGDPLMHIIRNAVDHGIESPDERERKGKPEMGTIKLIGERERDRVSVTVEDDGRGLDVARIKQKAIEKGVITESEAELLDDSEVYDFIFHPGFSTQEEVTEVSGRGVGLDVVNQVVRGVDGSINVESAPDEGTSVTLTLPVSVAIVRVLFVTAGEEMYGVPIKNIDEISEFEDVTIESIEGQPIVTHDERVYPLISLGEALDVPDTEPGENDMIVRIKENVRQVCLRCSDVVEQEEVVIKPFEGVLSGAPGISGASVLGEGEVVMILDVETL